MNLYARCQNCTWDFSDGYWDSVLVASGSHSMLEYHSVTVTGLGVVMVIGSTRRKS